MSAIIDAVTTTIVTVTGADPDAWHAAVYYGVWARPGRGQRSVMRGAMRGACGATPMRRRRGSWAHDYTTQVSFAVSLLKFHSQYDTRRLRGGGNDTGVYLPDLTGHILRISDGRCCSSRPT